MAGKYWIKLYKELIDDPKMGMLTDRLYRRTIEIFCLADDDGYLPTIKHMSWKLHRSIEEIETDLADLGSTGIVQSDGSRWLVTNYVKRQAPVTAADRMRYYRERKQKETYYGDEPSDEDVTKRNRETELELETETDDAACGRISSLYEQEIGALTPFIGEQIGEWVGDYSPTWIEDAIKVAAGNNKRKMSYINGILKNWQTEGRGEKTSIEKELARKGYAQR